MDSCARSDPGGLALASDNGPLAGCGLPNRVTGALPSPSCELDRRCEQNLSAVGGGDQRGANDRPDGAGRRTWITTLRALPRSANSDRQTILPAPVNVASLSLVPGLDPMEPQDRVTRWKLGRPPLLCSFFEYIARFDGSIYVAPGPPRKTSSEAWSIVKMLRALIICPRVVRWDETAAGDRRCHEHASSRQRLGA